MTFGACGSAVDVRDANLVVRAVMSGLCQKRDEAEPYQFQKNARGVLNWKPAKEGSGLWEPVVIWDDDPEKVPRRMPAQYLEIIGIQTADRRFIIEQVPQ